MNKKILAILMALLMVLMGSVAFAADEAPAAPKSNSFTITKQYNTADSTLVPGEELTFTANFVRFEDANTAEPDPTTPPIYSGKVTAVVGANTVTINATGAYQAAGKYYYTLSETPGSVQGVTYGDETINFVLIVGYAEGSSALTLLDVGVVKGADGKKNGTITNEYKVGGAKISKTVSGNAANVRDTFDAEVTITAAAGKVLPAEFTINYTDRNNTTAKAVKLTKDKATFKVSLMQGTDVVINNLPLGAIVTVAENDSKVNGADEKDASKYDATYENNGAAAAAENAPTIAVTNTRKTTIDTGVDTDSMPYIMLMAFVMMLAAAVVLKKRTVND